METSEAEVPDAEVPIVEVSFIEAREAEVSRPADRKAEAFDTSAIDMLVSSAAAALSCTEGLSVPAETGGGLIGLMEEEASGNIVIGADVSRLGRLDGGIDVDSISSETARFDRSGSLSAAARSCTSGLKTSGARGGLLPGMDVEGCSR